jgi:hypothetical protein
MGLPPSHVQAVSGLLNWAILWDLPFTCQNSVKRPIAKPLSVVVKVPRTCSLGNPAFLYDLRSSGGTVMGALLGVLCITVFLFLLVGVVGAVLFGERVSRS